MSTKKAILWSVFWVTLAMLFNWGIYMFWGKAHALEFLGGYVLEKSLSVDNLFLFLMVFSSFGIKAEQQRRILNYGIVGAVILRLVFILLGVSIIDMFSWVLYVFGAILIYSGVKILFDNEEEEDFSNSKILKFFGKIIPITDKVQGNKFFVRKNKILYATPLLAILVLVEFTDILFAIDSIPAIFSITTNPFIVYTSNIFAIMGLRSMYFILVNLKEKFRYIKYGVSLVLTFTGLKLLVLFFGIHIPVEMSLGIIFTILFVSMVSSVVIDWKQKMKSAASIS